MGLTPQNVLPPIPQKKFDNLLWTPTVGMYARAEIAARKLAKEIERQKRSGSAVVKKSNFDGSSKALASNI